MKEWRGNGGMDRTFVDLPIKVVCFCSEEVRRQHDAPETVGYLAMAWSHAMNEKAKGRELDEYLLSDISFFALQGKNQGGQYRSVRVRVGDRICPDPREVPDLMKRWFEHLPDMTPEDAYLEFEQIHPHVDCNGRIGKIIFFWLRDELEKPNIDKVPNPWGIANR